MSARPHIAIVDDPLAPGPARPTQREPSSADGGDASQPTARTVTPKDSTPAPENGPEPERTATLFARLPASLLWTLDSAALTLSASDRRRGKVPRQELVAALIWRTIGREPSADTLAVLGELVDEYRAASRG